MGWKNSKFDASNWWASLWSKATSSPGSSDSPIMFKDGMILMKDGRIAMSGACCCDYTPPAVCVDCGPPYVSGQMALMVSGFVDQEPIPICCDTSPFAFDPRPPHCHESTNNGYQSNQYFSGSNWDGIYSLDPEGVGSCCWTQYFYNPLATITCGGATGPITGYYECWDTRYEPSDHLWRVENRLGSVKVCLFDGGDNVHWSVLLSETCCIYKDGVLQLPTSGACVSLTCWETVYPYHGSFTKHDFCNNHSSTLHGVQKKMGVGFIGYSGGPTAGVIFQCTEEIISNLTFTLHPSNIFV